MNFFLVVLHKCLQRIFLHRNAIILIYHVGIFLERFQVPMSDILSRLDDIDPVCQVVDYKDRAQDMRVALLHMCPVGRRFEHLLHGPIFGWLAGPG